MDRIITDVRDISEMPRLCQMNNASLEPSLDRYILGGTKCTMDERLCRSLKVHIERSVGFSTVSAVIFKVIGIMLLLTLIFPLISIIFCAAKGDGRSAATTFIFIVPIIAFGVFLLWLSSQQKKQHNSYSKAMESIVPNHSECYRYKRHEIMRYSYDSVDSTEYRYYIDLGNFIVELINPSEKWGFSEYVYGAILNVNGRSVFMLFYEE